MVEQQKDLLITGGISTTEQADYKVTDLAPNNYLTIIWKNKQGEQFNSLDIDDKQALQFTNDLNNAIEQGVTSGKISYAGQSKYVNLESIAKYLAQNIIPDSPKRQIANAFIGLATGSNKKLPDETINLILNVFGEVAEKTARHFGFSDPHEVFASFASENTIKLFRELGDKAGEFIQDKIAKFTHKAKASVTSKTSEEGKKYVGLIMGVTTSDTESYEISIPRKKVEDGSDYTTHLLPQPFKKDFNVTLTNKILSSDFNRTVEIENIEKVKDKLIEIAQSRILFDIYIRLSSDKCYKRSNVYFSSISFSKDEGSGNGYECSFSIEPIAEFKSKIFVSNRKYFPTASKPADNGYGTTFGSGRKGSGGSRNSGKTANGNMVNVGFMNDTHTSINMADQYMSYDKMMNFARQAKLYVKYSKSTNPNYLFVDPRDVTNVNGKYVLDNDVWKPTGSSSIGGGRQVTLKPGIHFSGNSVTNNKQSYTILVP